MAVDDEQTLRLVSGLSSITRRAGVYVGFREGFAVVDMGGERFDARFASAGFVPQPNDAVWVETIGNGVERSVYMTGPATPRPGLGVVLTVGDPLVTVSTDFGEFSMPFAGEQPTSGDTVGISWSSGPWCSKLSTSPEEPPPPPDPTPAPAPKVQEVEFRPFDAGTTHGNGDWWQREVWAADNNVGAWFYGNSIRDTIPSNAEFVSLQVYVNRIQRFGSPPNWAAHNLTGKSGVPSFAHLTSWHPDGNGFQTPPNAHDWFNALKGGGSHVGIGLNHGGYNKFASLASDGMSGALKISWKA